jgi:hypothetical protein
MTFFNRLLTISLFLACATFSINAMKRISPVNDFTNQIIQFSQEISRFAQDIASDEKLKQVFSIETQKIALGFTEKFNIYAKQCASNAHDYAQVLTKKEYANKLYVFYKNVVTQDSSANADLIINGFYMEKIKTQADNMIQAFRKLNHITNIIVNGDTNQVPSCAKSLKKMANQITTKINDYECQAQMLAIINPDEQICRLIQLEVDFSKDCEEISQLYKNMAASGFLLKTTIANFPIETPASPLVNVTETDVAKMIDPFVDDKDIDLSDL